jgi:hypothetical protein
MGDFSPKKVLDPAGLFTEDKAPEPAPAPPPAAEPVEMPIADDKASTDAAKRRVAAMRARSGRASTILTDSGGKLGG